MTPDQIADALSFVALKWPHSTLGASPRQAQAAWLDELADFDAGDVELALRRLAGEREHAPTAGIVRAEVLRALQGAPPSFDELQAWLSRNVRLLPYGQSSTPVDTAMAIAALADAGAHEAVLRLVQTQGLWAVRMAPDPSRHGLDPNQLADRRDVSRFYRDTTLTSWQRDPRPGQALERACERAGLDSGELLELAARARRERLAGAASPRAVLPAGEPLPTPDEPMVGPAEVLAAYRAERAKAHAQQRTERARARAEEIEQRRAALAELAEHAVARSAS